MIFVTTFLKHGFVIFCLDLKKKKKLNFRPKMAARVKINYIGNTPVSQENDTV